MRLAKIISAIAIAICTFATATAVYATETSELPTSLINGSFEIPVVGEISKTDGDLSSGTQGAWYLQTNEGFEEMAKNQGYDGFGWRTTAYDEKIELVSVNRADTSGYKVEPYDGDQFAELIAEEQSSIYQTISTTTVGEVFNWKLAHAGRSTKDTMGLFIGPAQANYQKNIAAGNDIFMWMAELIKNTSQIDWETAEVGYTKHTVYSREDIDLSEVTSQNYTEYFSFTKTAEINQEWRCWLITDDAGVWGEYSDFYTVPDDQPETTFAFTAITGYENYPTIKGQYNEGNLLDAISFATFYPLRVATTQGGTGTVSAGETTQEVSYDADYTGIFDDGTVVTVTAIPQEGYHLLGMYINGVFCTGDDAGHFTDLGDGVYSHTVTMDTARYVQLVFAKEGTVIYDPNGGTFRDSPEDTEIRMASVADEENNTYEKWANTEDALPPNDKTRFIGWYVGRIAYNGAAGGALITSDHTVTYNTGTVPGDTSDDTIDLDYTLAVRNASSSQAFDLSDGLVMIAEWEYLQETAVRTKPMEDGHYLDDNTGGYVTQTIADIDSDRVRDNGYGRLRDVVTLHAKANDGYRFRGWYDTEGNLLSIRDVYEYEVSGHTIVYAYFSELHHPIVSFVSATGNELLNGQSTHTIYCGTGVTPESALTGIGGENVYGSTISTGFITRQLLDPAHKYAYSQWSIIIPVPDGENSVFIKKSSDATSSNFVFDATPVIEDASGVQVNKGNIYKVTSFVDGSDHITINLFNTLFIPTIMTSEGEIELIYGITLDSIYAPGAQATLDLKEHVSDMLFESVDITEDGEKFNHSKTFDEYLTDADNKYSTAKPVSEAK
ncbi:MAG: hypothetical protein IJC09_03195 [Clostridia bacterium]|nr:hypothetical protein [Clostridia bacterium]